MTRAIRYLYLILFFVTPFIFTSFNSELFELPKMYFIYGLSLGIIFLHLFNFLNGQVPLFRRTPLTIPLFLFLLSQIISTIFSIDPHTSFFGYYSRLNGGLLSLIVYSLLYWILVIYINDNLKSKIISTSLLAGLAVSIYGILQHFGIDAHYWSQDVVARVFSTLGQPNWLAAYLCILLPLSLDKFLNSKTKIQLTFYFLLSTFYYLCLLFTKSKTGIIAAIISLGIYFLFKFKKYFYRISFIAISFIVLSISINNPIRDFLFPQNLQSPITDHQPLNITPSENIRQIVWTGAINLWQKFPLIGTGPETFAYSYYWTRPASHNLTSEWDFLYNKAHNEYLNYLTNTGAFGLITYLILIIFIIFLVRTGLDLSLLIAFISILITNFSGFSVAITSLYFFLLPAIPFSPIPTSSQKPKPIIFKFILLSFIVYLFPKLLFFYLADITYAQSQKYDSANAYQPSFDQIKLALNYRPNEPIYLIQAANVSAKLAITTKDPNYINQAIIFADTAFDLSPFNTNLLKQRAQVYYYLASLDSKYLLTAIDSLVKTAHLAPTDAKTYYLLGQFLEAGQQYPKAIEFYQQAAKLKSNYDHAYFALGRLYFDASDYQNATTAFNQVLKISPTNSDAVKYLQQIPN